MADDLTQVMPGWQEGGVVHFASGQKPKITQYRPPALLRWEKGTYIRLTNIDASLTEAEYGYVGEESEVFDDPAYWYDLKRLYAPAMAEILGRLKSLMES